MASRLLATGLLLASGLLAWLAISLTLAARLLQAAILVSVIYVGYLAWHGWRVMRRALREAGSGAGTATGDARDLPFVSVVVPARDEASVVGSATADLVSQRYAERGRPRYEVLVVDDGSSDETGRRARAAAGEARHLRILRREPGSGAPTKAGVLRFAEPYVRGEVVAVVDADARVSPEFLERLMRGWRRDADAAAIQGQRRPQSDGGGWMAAAQLEEQLLDMATQAGRWATDGTAELRGNGMAVRRDVLERLGGWDEAALTEDLELSSRLSAAGLHVTLAPEAAVGEDAVVTWQGLWAQRMRWAEGSLRRLLDHGPRLLAGPQPIGRKVDFLVFTAEFLVPPLFATTIAASLVTIPLPGPADWTVPASLFASYGIGGFLMALAALAADGRRGLHLLGGSLRCSLFMSHWLVVIPAALLKIAFGPRTVVFAKTPRAPRGTDR